MNNNIIYNLVLCYLLLNLVSLCEAVWPQPSNIQQTNFPLALDYEFKITSAKKEACPILSSAFDRYRELIFLNNCSRLSPDSPCKKPVVKKINAIILSELSVDYGKCESIPDSTMDESYTLYVDEYGGNLTAPQVWGVLRGLETFSQLIYFDGTTAMINKVTVRDQPRFSFRGFLLDTSRHYLPLHHIKSHLDAMAYAKMNVFHWHIVDDQSFPYESTVFPELSDKGSYSPMLVYSPSVVQEIIRYAADRGIRVVPEFDTPGHTESWGKGRPDILTLCYDSKGKEIPGTFGPIDPSSNSTYKFLSKFFKETSQVFPDDYVHLGGDEVNPTCWVSNAKVNEFMKSHGIKDISQLQGWHMTKISSIVNSFKKRQIVWQEVFDHDPNLPSDTIIHVWKGGESDFIPELKNVTAHGYQTILSAPWYLDYISVGEDWIKYYNVDPQSFNDTKNLVIGGSACMWGEYIDGNNLISQNWPRGAAIAERLWSPASVRNVNEARERLLKFRCLIVKRGIRAKPVKPGFCECDYYV